MNKKIIFSTLIILAFAASAQDTVRYSDPWYIYNERGFLAGDTINAYHRHVSPNRQYDDSIYGAVIDNFVNPNHPWLYGIALTLADSVSGLELATDYTSVYLNVYHGIATTPIYASTNYWWTCSSHETLCANRNNVKQCMFEYKYDLATLDPTITRCYELYFDQPVPIATEDTLFIGTVLVGAWELHCAYDSTMLHDAFHLFHDAAPRGHKVQYPYWGGIFPIVGLRCTAPRDFRLCDEAVPIACWRGDTNAITFQMSVCNSLVEPELGSLSTVYDTSINLSSLHPDSAYMVYLRKMCSFVCADTVWSDWSGPIVIGDTTGWASHNTGVADASLVDITLTPNPATERVIVSAIGMQSVELLAVDGTVIMRRDGLMQDEYTLDLKGLAAGLYMVRVGTPLGTATRRLLVQ